ncbi:hypothetical protein Asppvi_007840 [Aspergillus pseudoviridinutans]|uniref:Uncharacterized protein n=1 Tax=Aspergillus pseudoviridinutans TaxID=1517512 RepID=A0A9P3EWV2_9EURO|nr:uncharacterized protein Asppvi_007840 [Aspergillus pseudoviridinutans]GIJ88912.1 hypothetical protein Asppvi_007840 [Aspergillus pseudoviridinutans]
MMDCLKASKKKHHAYVNPLYKEKRDAYVDGLHDTWKLVSNVEDPYLGPASLAKFGIECHNLLQESSFDEAPYATKFFRKMPHEKLQEYEIDCSDKQTMIDVSVQKDLSVSNEQDLCDELHPLGLAGAMCNALQLAFDTHERKTTDHWMEASV